MPNEQPEPKPYPIKGQHGSCPFKVQGWEHTPERTSVQQAPCDPFDCALGIKGTKLCCLRDLAHTMNSLYMWNCDRTAGETQTQQLIKELSDRLGAILQTLAGSHKALPDMLRYFYDSQFAERALGLETVLSYINAAVQRIAPKAKTGDPT